MNSFAGKLMAGSMSMPFMFKYSLSNRRPSDCLSPQEEAEQLRALMDSNNGGMPSDPEAFREFLGKQQVKRDILPYEALCHSISAMTMMVPNDGCKLNIPMFPLMSQNFQPTGSVKFSNSKPTEIGMMLPILVGGTPMKPAMMFQVMSESSGMLMAASEINLPYDCKMSMVLQAANLEQYMPIFNFQKDFADSHIRYVYQGIHQLQYMQGITQKLIAGVQLSYVHGQAVFGYTARFEDGKDKFFAAYTPLVGETAFMLGYLNKVNKNLTMFTQFKNGRSLEAIVGQKLQMNEYGLLNSISTSGKMNGRFTVANKMGLQMTFSASTSVFNNTGPVQFGVSIGMQGME